MRFILLSAAIFCAGFLIGPSSALAASSFLYNFNSVGTLKEAGTSAESSSPYFWLNSGAKLVIQNGTGSTIENSLLATDPFRILYSVSNPTDTDLGFKPQNIFRLVTKNSWANADTEVAFRTLRDNLSASPNRNASNGVLLMTRYVDSDNLYYAGVRVDGAAVIKKKIGGIYYTLASAQVFGTKGTYNRDTNPDLIPGNTWMRMKSELRTNADGSVSIRLLLDKENKGSFTPVLSVTDNGTGGAPILEGRAGIRTDFMDAEFDNFRVIAY